MKRARLSFVRSTALLAAREVTTDVDPDAIADSKSAAWCAQQADALVAVAKAYLDGGHSDEGGATADHYQVVVHADAKSLTGGTGRIFRLRQ